MKFAHLAVATVLVPLAAIAEGPASAVGSWALPDGSPCAMTFTLTADGQLTRTAGTLTYSTKAKLSPNGKGWTLEEKLKEYNNGTNCRGQSGDAALTHLESKAYVEVKDNTLRYSRRHGEAPAHTFVRAGS